MTILSAGPEHRVLIIGPDALRAEAAGALIDPACLLWDYLPETLASVKELHWDDHDVIIVMDDAFDQASLDAITSTHAVQSRRAVLVGLVRPGNANKPSLSGTGFDLILYEPLVQADIERMHALADAVQRETPNQARERLRKMTALHELAVASGHRTGTARWLDHLIEAGRQILGVDALAMWSHDPSLNRVTCLSSSGLDPKYIDETEEKSHELVDEYQTLLRHLPSNWFPANQAETDFKHVCPRAARAIGIDRIAWLPVRDGNRLYGHLSFYFMGEGSHETYDPVLADAFASIVAAALGTYWLQTEIRRSNRLYREQVEASPDGVVVLHLDGTIERSNVAMEEIAGRDRYAMIGKPIFDWFLHPEELPWDEWARLEPEESADSVELWLSRESGERRRVAFFARRVQFPDPRKLGETEDRIQLVVKDITDQARRLIELELFHDLNRLISNQGSIEDAYNLVVSRLYCYLNYRLVLIGEVIRKGQIDLQTYRAHSDELLVPSVLDISQGLCGRAIRENSSFLVQDVDADPDYIAIDNEVVNEVVAVIRVDGIPIGLIDIQTDATQPLDDTDLQLAESIAAHLGLLIEQVTIYERLEQQALTDPLTGIANRRAFMQHLSALIEDPESAPAALLLVELDRFKSINDRYGHLFGDEMLKQVTARLRTALRENDLLARYGGDEIAMIFHNMSPNDAFDIAERLRNTISSEPFVYNGQMTTITVSIGIALYPFHGNTADALIGEADRAMYAAKLRGRNAVYGDVAGAG